MGNKASTAGSAVRQQIVKRRFPNASELPKVAPTPPSAPSAEAEDRPMDSREFLKNVYKISDALAVGRKEMPDLSRKDYPKPPRSSQEALAPDFIPGRLRVEDISALYGHNTRGSEIGEEHLKELSAKTGIGEDKIRMIFKHAMIPTVSLTRTGPSSVRSVGVWSEKEIDNPESHIVSFKTYLQEKRK